MQMNNSRRDFLKKSALSSAVLAASGSASAAVAGEMGKRTTKIPSASHFGAFYAHVRDEKIVDITSQLDSNANPTVIVKGLAHRNSSKKRW